MEGALIGSGLRRRHNSIARGVTSSRHKVGDRRGHFVPMTGVARRPSGFVRCQRGEELVAALHGRDPAVAVNGLGEVANVLGDEPAGIAVTEDVVGPQRRAAGVVVDDVEVDLEDPSRLTSASSSGRWANQARS